MYPKALLCCLLVLLCLKVHVAIGRVPHPTSTAQIIPAAGLPGGIDGPIYASIAGTGTDGTTYVVQGTIEPTSTEIPFTATIVEDATHLSGSLAVTTGSLTVDFLEECSMNTEHFGICTKVLGSSTSVVSGTITLDGVLFASSSAASRSRDIEVAFALCITFAPLMSALIFDM